MPKLSNPELLLKDDIKHLKTYILGKDELEKPRELSEQEKKDIAHREMFGLNWHDPASDQELDNNVKRDVIQLIQNPMYRAGLDTTTQGISGLSSGAGTGYGLYNLIAKKPGFKGSLISSAIGAGLGVIPPLLTNAIYYERQKLVNKIVKTYIKNHPEGQIESLANIYKSQLAKKRTANQMKAISKTIKTSSIFDEIPKVTRTEIPMDFDFHKDKNNLNTLNAYITGISGVGLLSNAVQNIYRYSTGKQQLDDLRERLERRKKEKAEADILLHKVQAPLFKKHKTEKDKADEFDELFKKSEDITVYHGSPNPNITHLNANSYVTPKRRIAEIMGRYFKVNGKTWSDSDLETPHFLNKEPKFKKETTPDGEANIYKGIIDKKDLDLLDNPYEHKTIIPLKVEKIADELPLQPHQQRVVNKLMQPNQPGLIAYHMMGSGKTRVSLEAYKNLKMPTEVIVPASLRGNYEKEIHKWIGKHPKNLHVDSQQNIARNAPDEHAYDGKFMIVDEAHRLRNQDSKTYKNLKETNPAKRLLLTGTPIYNDVSDIAKLINLAAGKDILPERKPEFEKEFIGTKVVFPSLVHRFLGVQPGQELSIKNKDFLQKVFDKMIDYHGGNSDEFPEVTHETVKVPMSTHQQEIYNAVMKKLPWYMRMKVQAGLPPDKKELDKLIPFLTGARMIANSTGGFEKDVNKIESPKIDKAVAFLKQKIDEDPTYKGVVYSNYLNAGVNAYKKKLQETGIPYGEFTGEINDKVRNQLVKDYNTNKIKALLISSAASEGLDLRGTRLMQILEPHFNNEKIEQVQARGIRYKSHSDLPPEKRNVLVQHYLSTIYPSIYDKLTSPITGSKNLSSDEYLQQMSDEKSKLNNAFLDLIRKKNERTSP